MNAARRRRCRLGSRRVCLGRTAERPPCSPRCSSSCVEVLVANASVGLDLIRDLMAASRPRRSPFSCICHRCRWRRPATSGSRCKRDSTSQPPIPGGQPCIGMRIGPPDSIPARRRLYSALPVMIAGSTECLSDRKSAFCQGSQPSGSGLRRLDPTHRGRAGQIKADKDQRRLMDQRRHILAWTQPDVFASSAPGASDPEMIVSAAWATVSRPFAQVAMATP